MDQPGSERQEPRPWGWGRIAHVVGGWLLIVVGVLGCVLPILPGVPLILGGLALLSEEYAWARRWAEQFKQWLARVRRKAQSPEDARQEQPLP